MRAYLLIKIRITLILIDLTVCDLNLKKSDDQYLRFVFSGSQNQKVNIKQKENIVYLVETERTFGVKNF